VEACPGKRKTFFVLSIITISYLVYPGCSLKKSLRLMFNNLLARAHIDSGMFFMMGAICVMDNLANSESIGSYCMEHIVKFQNIDL